MSYPKYTLNTQLINLTCAYDYEPIIFETQKITRDNLKGFNANAPPFS